MRLLNDTSLASRIYVRLDGEQYSYDSYGDVVYNNSGLPTITYIDANSRSIVTAMLPRRALITIITNKPQVKENSDE